MFPVIYTPTIINKIGLENPVGLTYFVIILSEFILISLYNIQDQMEYPLIRMDWMTLNWTISKSIGLSNKAIIRNIIYSFPHKK